MRVCAHARIWMSQGVRKERQYLCALPLSLSLLGYTCLPDLRSSAPAFSRVPSSVFFCAESGEGRWDILWPRMGYHMVPGVYPLQASPNRCSKVPLIEVIDMVERGDRLKQTLRCRLQARIVDAINI